MRWNSIRTSSFWISTCPVYNLRFPTERERSILLNSYRYNLDRYQTHPEAALKLLMQGESPRDTSLNPNELAAWTQVASLILNLDETVTRQ